MTDLLLQPTGDPDDFEVMAKGQVLGRIVLLAGIWSWAIGTVPVYATAPNGQLLVLVADRFACPVNKMRLGASRTRHHFECIAVGRRTIVSKPCLHFHARRGAAVEYGSHDVS